MKLFVYESIFTFYKKKITRKNPPAPFFIFSATHIEIRSHERISPHFLVEIRSYARIRVYERIRSYTWMCQTVCCYEQKINSRLEF